LVEGVKLKPQRGKQAASLGKRSGRFASGYDIKTPGTPGTNARIVA